MQLWDIASALAFLDELDANCARARQVCSEAISLLPDDSPSVIQVKAEFAYKTGLTFATIGMLEKAEQVR